MPAVRTSSRPMRAAHSSQLHDSLQTTYLESARTEFSLRKRVTHCAAPLSPPASPTLSLRPCRSPVSPRVTSRTKATSPTQKKKKAPNAFILYRSYALAHNLLPETITHQNDVSVRVAELWRSETDEVKRRFYEMAVEEKERMESQGLLSYSNHSEKAKKPEDGTKPRFSKRSLSGRAPSPTAGPKRQQFIALSSPPPSPELKPHPTPSSVHPEKSTVLSTVSQLEGVPDPLPIAELPLINPLDFEWASISLPSEVCSTFTSNCCDAAGPSFSETDAWNAVRVYIDSHPDAFGPSVGMTVPITTDTEEDLVSLFSKTLDFSTYPPLSGTDPLPSSRLNVVHADYHSAPMPFPV